MSISEQDLLDAISAWGNGLVEISEAFENEGIVQATSVAENMLDRLYGFNLGPVLFKPTLSGGTQTFRPTREAALSYFVGQNSDYSSDTGFGIKYWRRVIPETSAFFINDNVAMWMGWVTFFDKDDFATKVDKSWGYRLDTNGNLKIVLHHSSLPYQQ